MMRSRSAASVALSFRSSLSRHSRRRRPRAPTTCTRRVPALPLGHRAVVARLPGRRARYPNSRPLVSYRILFDHTDMSVPRASLPLNEGGSPVGQRLITPSKITAWLDCPHYLTLRNRVDDGALTEPDPIFGSFAQLLQHKGEVHEQDCLDDYRHQGKSVHVGAATRVKEKETFAAWVDRVGDSLAAGWDVVYQMPFMHDGVRGIADFLERVNVRTARVAYEPVDAKLTRDDAKPGHVLQLCFYADAIEALTGVEPERMHMWLGSGSRRRCESTNSPVLATLARTTRRSARRGPGGRDRAGAVPALCRSASSTRVCEQQWRDEDSLIYVAGHPPARARGPRRGRCDHAGAARRADRALLRDRARSDWTGWCSQAVLQVQARLSRRGDRRRSRCRTRRGSEVGARS